MRNAFVMVVLCALAFGGAAVAQPNLDDFTSTGIPVGKTESQVAPDPLGPLTFYGDRPSFDAAHPGLPVEDWEDFLVGAGGVLGCPAPANSTTSCAGGYNVGAIEPGLELLDDVGPDPDGLVILGSGFNGNPSIQFGSNTFVDALVINFNPAVGAAGMDIACHFNPDNVTIDIFDAGAGLIGSTNAACSNAGTFFGVDSTVAIASIRINSATDQAEVIDDVAFGGPVVPVTLQSIDVE